MDYHWVEIPLIEALAYSLLEVFGYVILFYSHSYLLSKTDIYSSPYIKGLIPLLLIPTYVLITRFSGIEYWLYEDTSGRNLYSMIMNASLFSMLSFLFYFYKKYHLVKERNLELANKQKEQQLIHLKNRLNPHFLFNVLNNLTALIHTKSEKVDQLVSDLSGVLRYAVDDGSNEKVKLTKEVEVIKKYIDMVTIQEPASKDIDLYIEGDMDDYIIHPFILITLVENAIKHGDYRNNPEGFLHIKISMDHELQLDIKNSFQPKTSSSNSHGLINIQEQLNLAYPNQHELVIRQDGESYHLILNISLPKM